MDGSTRPGGRTARVRRNVLEATLEVLAERGWNGTTVEIIAERSGVHKTTIYRRWGSAQLVALDALLDRGDTAVPVPDTGDVVQDLMSLGRSIADNLSDPLGRAVATAAISESDSETLQQLASAFWAERFSDAGVVIERGIKRGELSEFVNPEETLEGIASSIWFRLMVRRLPISRNWLERTVRTSLDRE